MTRAFNCEDCGIGVIDRGGLLDLCSRCLALSVRGAFVGVNRAPALYVPGTLAEQMEAAVRRVIADLDRLP